MDISGIKSEIEKYKEFVKPGMSIFYTDAAGGQKFTVVSSSPESDEFEIVGTDGNHENLSFSSLQFGWSFSQADKDFIDGVLRERVGN